MPLAAKFILTLLCAGLIGFLLDRLHIPGGMMVGAVIGACLLETAAGAAAMPAWAKTAAQIVAGAFIGAGISREDIRGMRSVLKPAAIVLPGLLLVNAAAGLLIWKTGRMDLLTALLCCTPGGISDMPIIAADLGADASMVVVLQFVRLVMGIGVFPLMIRLVAGKGSAVPNEKREASAPVQPGRVLAALSVSAVCGLIGRATPIPAGTMAFATLGSCAYACTAGRTQIPRTLRKGAQLLSGAYVGAGIGAAELMRLTTLGVPALILVAAYTLGCFGMGFLLMKTGCFALNEGMLAATPAGASDMALISADLGVKNASIIVLQVLRLMTVVLLFPTILSFIAHLLD